MGRRPKKSIYSGNATVVVHGRTVNGPKDGIFCRVGIAHHHLCRAIPDLRIRNDEKHLVIAHLMSTTWLNDSSSVKDRL